MRIPNSLLLQVRFGDAVGIVCVEGAFGMDKTFDPSVLIQAVCSYFSSAALLVGYRCDYCRFFFLYLPSSIIHYFLSHFPLSSWP